MGNLAGQGRKKPQFNEAATRSTDTEVSNKVEVKPDTNTSTEVSTNNTVNPIEELRKKHEAARKAKPAKKKQISTYLDPDVLKAYNAYGTGRKGEKQDLINDLLRTYFGIEKKE